MGYEENPVDRMRGAEPDLSGTTIGARRSLPCDYAYCANRDCPLRDRCLRAVERSCPLPRWIFYGRPKHGKCEHYIPRL